MSVHGDFLNLICHHRNEGMLNLGTAEQFVDKRPVRRLLPANKRLDFTEEFVEFTNSPLLVGFPNNTVTDRYFLVAGKPLRLKLTRVIRRPITAGRKRHQFRGIPSGASKKESKTLSLIVG